MQDIAKRPPFFEANEKQLQVQMSCAAGSIVQLGIQDGRENLWSWMTQTTGLKARGIQQL